MEKSKLGAELVKAGYLEGDFVLRSGMRSKYYFDKYLFLTKPHILRPLAKLVAALVPPDVDRLAGPELGAVALATAVSLELNKPFVLVRKEEKGYATANLIEGELNPGERVVLVEDILTTGGQALVSAATLSVAGATVVGIIGVVDREEGAAQRIAEAGYSFEAVFRRSDLPIPG